MSIRVGNGAGFWGDDVDAPVRLARNGDLDFLTLEYLAELTTAILAHRRAKDPEAGFVTDFLELIKRISNFLVEQPRLKIVTNAGGLNPVACVRNVGSILVEAGLGRTSVAVVAGDDLLKNVPEWIRAKIDLVNMDTGESIVPYADRLIAFNAYLGAKPIARAIGEGARIVITGRVADASLTLGPAVASFGWGWDEYDLLAAASTAGHVIECGAQATGGLWSDWDAIPDPASIGYPIALLDRDGSCVITKPERSGGMVTAGTIAEQLVYEIDDPSRYRTPDVDVDLTHVELDQVDKNRVRIRGAKGNSPSDFLKVSAVYRDGWTASALVAVVGRGAVKKARAAGELVVERVRRAGYSLAQSRVEVIGAGDVVPGVLNHLIDRDPVEVMLRVTARDPSKEAIERFCRSIAPLVTSGPPGIAGYATGRPRAIPAFGYAPVLIPRELVAPKLEIRTATEWEKTNASLDYNGIS
jgi:hypothetical protein